MSITMERMICVEFITVLSCYIIWFQNRMRFPSMTVKLAVIFHITTGFCMRSLCLKSFRGLTICGIQSILGILITIFYGRFPFFLY